MPQAQIKQSWSLKLAVPLPSWSYIYHNIMYYMYKHYFRSVHYISKAFNIPLQAVPLLPLISGDFLFPSTNSEIF